MIARRALFGLLDRIEDGRIVVVDGPGGDRRSFGHGDLHAEVVVHDRSAYRHVLRGSTGLADSYLEGAWDADDLLALLRIGARNMARLDGVRRRWHPLLHAGQRAARTVPRNDRARARRHVAAHYDLGNDLFSLFLDESMMYSCAYFAEAGMDLAAAQRAKLDRICRALDLRPGDRLLEIGAGWGALAVHAAGAYGAEVTTTTISAEQRAAALERVAAAGLSDRVTVLDADYRDLTGSYDKLVSIEMVEAVGWQYFDDFFARCSALLAGDGLMLLQAIVIDDASYEVEKASRSFANTHVFPGGCLPSRAVIADCVERVTDLREVWTDDITDHYVATLEHWRSAFEANIDRAERLGYDERFQRLWRLYLAYVQAGFAERRIGNLQLLLAKPGRTAATPPVAALSSAGSG